MNKTAKTAMITALTLCAVGMVLSTAGYFAGGNFNDSSGHVYISGGTDSARKNLEVMEKQQMNAFTKLNVDFQNFDLDIRKSGDDCYYMEYRLEKGGNENPLTWENKGGELTLQETSGGKGSYYISYDLGNLLHHTETQKQEEIKTERLRLKLQKQTQKQYIGELKSDIANAKKTSKLNRLYSPVNGEVIAKNLAPGDFVTGGVSVITIADMDKTQIRTEYIGSSVLDRASGYQAVINGKKYKVTAQEQDVSQMDVEMGNLPTSTYFDYEKDANVSVGDSVTLEFYNNATEDALVVPSNAVFKAKSEHYVYRMDGDAKKKVKVTLGTKTDAYTQIMSGLKEGDVVYVQD